MSDTGLVKRIGGQRLYTMIGESRVAYVFIRTFILLLRSITPLSILYCSLRPFLRVSLRASTYIELAALAESLFYFLVFLPRRHRLQGPVDHPAPLSRSSRKKLFDRCLDTVPDGRRFLQLGTVGFDHHIRRENVKEWFCWAFMNRGTWGEEEDQELEEYVQDTETLAGQRIPPGHGHVQSLRITLDKFTALHRRTDAHTS